MTLSAFRDWLETLAAARATIPAEEALRRLPAAEGGAGDTLAALDVEQAGEALGRSPSTVRDYCRAGLLDGAYRQQGREWRIPPGAIGKFQVGQAAEAAAKATPAPRAGSTDLAAWRKEVDAA